VVLPDWESLTHVGQPPEKVLDRGDGRALFYFETQDFNRAVSLIGK
jgi:hypothetical protein